ncbi:AAA family ATPase [Deinococcus sp. KNUC1210]|uniref:McrB family protein n=1 Tax=Deinococcus sp. KNUC1210 TaxID=2917691 RepID=UPI001EEF836A|nr:AAA family ATPase [Deinococcus sp. KNUC1210]ULH14470.1 AAA family ATPase [Deinococcus sp. KNUC1210]
MTGTQQGWIDWTGFVQEYEAVKDARLAIFNTRLKKVASEPLRQLFLEAEASLDQFVIEPAQSGLKLLLGQKERDTSVLWRAAAGLSPKRARLGLPGLNGPTAKVDSFNEGLNIWLEIPNKQTGQYFRSALAQKGAQEEFISALFSAAEAANIQITVGSEISYDSSLWSAYNELTQNREKHTSPFKDTQVTEENRGLLERVLRLYAKGIGKQTVLIINFSLSPLQLGMEPSRVSVQVKSALEAADKLTSLVQHLSSHAPELMSEVENQDDSKVDMTSNPVTAQLIHLADYTRNIILYGPPGTGKTYTSQEYAQLNQSENEAESMSQDDIYGLHRWEVIALILYVSEKVMSESELLTNAILSDYHSFLEIDVRNKPLKELLSKHLDDKEELRTTSIVQEEPSLFFKTKNSAWGISAQGRKYIEENLVKYVDLFKDYSYITNCKRIITFHPSFSYEEFVEGLRPVSINGQLEYVVKSGLFKQICQFAEDELERAIAKNSLPRPFLLIIDEINRANIAKVFGELMTLIEDDKRVTTDGKGLRVRLPYSGELFGVPENLTIIGTMNTADRSIALLDLALRRRFTFLEVLPDSEAIRATTGENGIIEGIDIASLLNSLNRTITQMLDRDHQLGHAYLTDIKRGLPELQFRWYRKVIPLLQEYFYNDGEKLEKVLGKTFITLGDRIGGLGGRRSYDIQYLDGPALTAALKALIGGSAVTAAIMAEEDN